jgi:signal peptidase
LILFFLYELYNFITVLMAERKKLASANAAETEEEIKKRAIEEFLAAQAAEKAKAEAEEEIKRRAVEEYLAAQAAKSAETEPTEESSEN